MDRGAVARLGGPHQEGIAEGTVVDEELGATTGRSRVARSLNEARNPKASDRVLERDQRLHQVVTPDRGESLIRRLIGRHREAGSAIDVQLESYFGMSQRQCGQGIVSRSRLTRY